MSSNFAKYGQQKKRQAIRQLQQRSKRQANSQRNPFVWTKEANSESNINQPVEGSRSLEPDVPENPTPTNLANNPFITEIKSSDENDSNVFFKEGSELNTTPIQPPASRSVQIEESAVLPSVPAVSLHGRRNPKTKSLNRQQLLTDFADFKLSETINPSKFQRKRGTCMHMCSVHEYSKRLEQDIYSAFETDSGKFLHHLAVKEYQRSAADLEESQPEDLRPSIILLKTVQYLFIDLLHKHQHNFDEMYDFLWNRTRAVRKDITQQRLCDIKTVTVLETIARFHIFSAYHLTGSATANFEHKYNNENLEKTLTSLRHLYDDLASGKQTSQNEAEFRMYHILLNLNSGLVLRDVSNLPISILNSPYVRYALDCYNAYNSKNFVRFFKLFKSGPSLLASCVLYRYINNIRQKALVAIINSHTTSSRGTGSSVDYSIDKLMNMLGCESVDETTAFVKSMEVDVSDTCSHAILRNRQYNVNNNQITHRLSVIDAKISLPIGRHIFTDELISDAVLGGPIPQSPTLPTVSSSRNSLVPATVLDHVVDQYVAQFALNEVSVIISECIKELQHLEKSKIHIIKELIDEACHIALKEEFTSIKNDVKKQVMVYTKEMYKDWYPSPLLDILLRDLVRESLVEEAGLSFVQETHYDLTTSVVKNELRSILEADSAYLNKFQIKMDNACEATYEAILNAVIKEELTATAIQIQNELLTEKKKYLKSQLQNSVVQKRYYFKIWKKRYSKIYSKRHTLDNIPPRLGSYSSSDVLKSLLGGQVEPTSDQSHLRLSSIAHIDLTSPTKSFQKKIDVRKKLKLRMDLLEEAMSLKGIPLKCLSYVKRPVYITIAVENLSSSVSKFVLDSFGVSAYNDESQDQDYSMKLVHMGESKLKIQLVNLSKASRKTLHDACKSSHLIAIQSNDNQISSSASQLLTSAPKILICLKKPSSWINQHIQEPSSLTNIRYCNLYKALDSAVEDALMYEINLPPFKLVDIRDFTQSLLCIKLTDVLLAKQVVLKDCSLYSVDPNTIISFYNSIVRHVSKAVMDSSLRNIDWPNQFDQRKDINLNWNEVGKLTELSKEIQSLSLPGFAGDPESASDCLQYCASVQTFCPQFLLSTVSSILENSGVQWCLILNQVIHHCIENALFSQNYTVLLESQICEIDALNGEKVVESALIFNELAGELSEYHSQPFTLNESDIAEIWESLAFYESKVSGQLATEAKNVSSSDVDHLKSESKQLDKITEDLEKLSSSISETESRLQSIVSDGALPSYLVKSLLGNK